MMALQKMQAGLSERVSCDLIGELFLGNRRFMRWNPHPNEPGDTKDRHEGTDDDKTPLEKVTVRCTQEGHQA